MRKNLSGARRDKRHGAAPHHDPKAADLSLSMATQESSAESVRINDILSNDEDGMSRKVARFCRVGRKPDHGRTVHARGTSARLATRMRRAS